MKLKNTVAWIVLILLGLISGYAFGSFKKAPEKNIKDLHYSYFSSKSFFDDAYKSIPKKSAPSDAARGVLVNHHLLAPHLIAETISTLATTDPITVVLVSPNHFSSGQGQIISSLYSWDTPYGVLDSDSATISKLTKQGALSIDEFPFEKEHGISGIVPFIKKSLPNAKIMPIIVKDTLSETARIAFVDSLYATLGNDVLVIGSFDFSHYLPDTVAQLHDKKSIAVIQNFDYAGMQTTETDSIPGLEITLRYMEKVGALHFNLIANTNSSQILHDPTVEEGTSYIDGSFSLGTKTSDDTATILAFGDMMLDRNVRKAINTNGAEYPFLPIKRLLMGNDIVVTNAEGPFTAHASKTLNVLNGPLTFTFDPALLPTLKKIGFTLFSQANNHTLNFKQQGLEESAQAIEKIGLNWFGDPLNNNLHSFTTTIRGQKIAFVGYHEFAYQGLDAVLNEIYVLKKSGNFVIVYPHWGMEYNKSMTQGQINTAHAFIDAGADAVIGSHPHVIEPMEIYKNKAIFYSLGNFIFDQEFSQATREGLAVGIALTPTKVSYYLFPMNIRNAQASLMVYDKRSVVLSDIAEHSFIQNAMKKELKNGVIVLNR
ncbi:MAG: AmmeMemoRadiSam system protein B [bacterium]|nr:AmmeMemoRadiSam system protein B [bacterium]